MPNDKYIVMKLATSEEIIAHMIHEDDYELKVLFPMIVRHTPRIGPMGGTIDQISMSPYTYFASDDEFTFLKHQIVFVKDLDVQYEAEYNRAIDDFINANAKSHPATSEEEMKELALKLQNMFKSADYEEELPEALVIPNTSKTIH